MGIVFEMLDVTADIVRAVILFMLVALSILRRPAQGVSLHGWNYLIAGFILFAFGSSLDVIKGSVQLSDSLTSDTVQTLALLALLVGYVGGSFFFIIGVYSDSLIHPLQIFLSKCTQIDSMYLYETEEIHLIFRRA